MHSYTRCYLACLCSHLTVCKPSQQHGTHKLECCDFPPPKSCLCAVDLALRTMSLRQGIIFKPSTMLQISKLMNKNKAKELARLCKLATTEKTLAQNTEKMQTVKNSELSKTLIFDNFTPKAWALHCLLPHGDAGSAREDIWPAFCVSPQASSSRQRFWFAASASVKNRQIPSLCWVNLPSARNYVFLPCKVVMWIKSNKKERRNFTIKLSASLRWE